MSKLPINTPCTSCNQSYYYFTPVMDFGRQIQFKSRPPQSWYSVKLKILSLPIKIFFFIWKVWRKNHFLRFLLFLHQSVLQLFTKKDISSWDIFAKQKKAYKTTYTPLKLCIFLTSFQIWAEKDDFRLSLMIESKHESWNIKP